MARASRPRDRLDSKHPLVRRVERALAESCLLPRGATVLVAVSGGGDSVFLLHALHALAAVRDLSLVVAHFNHGWRAEESDADARFVARLAAERGLPFHLGAASRRRLAVRSPEEAAREERYRFLARVARDRGAAVATGHTLDDQLETYLIGWLRGSGPAGASLMAAHGALPVPRSGVRVIRPLLALGREEIRETLRAAGTAWSEDRSNEDPRFLRNRVRSELIPLLESLAPGARRTIIRSATLAREAANLLRRLTEAEAGRLFSAGDGTLVADREAYLRTDPALRAALLARAVETLLGSSRDVEASHLVNAVGMVERRSGGKRTPLGPGAEVRLDRGRIIVSRRSPALHEPG